MQATPGVELLEGLYEQAVRDGERIQLESPVYINKAARLFAYWDNEARLPWQTESITNPAPLTSSGNISAPSP